MINTNENLFSSFHGFSRGKSLQKDKSGRLGVYYATMLGKYACVLSWCIIFSTWTHGKVFTKPSAKIARLNWADIQLLRKWMLLKGASQCCTPVSVKRPSLPLTLFFLRHLFMLLHLKLISHILWSDATDVVLNAKKKICFFPWSGAHSCMFTKPCIVNLDSKPQTPLYHWVLIWSTSIWCLQQPDEWPNVDLPCTMLDEC